MEETKPTLREALEQRTVQKHEESVAAVSRRLMAYAEANKGSAIALEARRSFSQRYVWAALAVAMIVVGVRYSARDVNPRDPESRSYTTKAGQRANISLANGSSVILGPATTLKVSESGVEINGEALFHVQHSAQNSFSVSAHGVTTRVLGTEFVVRAYDASQIRVAVRSGKVSVQSPAVTPRNAVVVSSGEAATVASNAIPVVAKINDPASDFSWASGELVLRDVPLGEALVRLSRWYGMEFRTDDSTLLTLNVESDFLASFDPQQLNALAKAIGAHVTRSGNVVTLSRR